MPHKYNTRIKTGTLTPFLYVGDNNDDNNDDDYDDDYYQGRHNGRELKSYITIDNDSDSDSDDDTNSSSSKDNNSSSESGDSDKHMSNNKNNVNKLNKLDYYKFLNDLYPSHYSKNKFIEDRQDIFKFNITKNILSIFNKF